MRYIALLFLLLTAPLLLSCEEGQAESSRSASDNSGEGQTGENRASASPTSTPEGTNSSPLTFSFPGLTTKESSAGILQEKKSTPVDSGTVPTGTFSHRLPPLAYHKGVNHAHVHVRGHGYGSPSSAHQHDWLHSIGANAISITPFGFQRGAKSDHIVGFGEGETAETRDGSMTLDDLAAEVDSAHRRGLHVMLKPHIWSNDFWNGAEWHGTIDQKTPEEHRRWWASYRKMILYYAEFAERSGIDYFCIGTELVQMTTKYPEEWRGLIADVRNVFKGGLTYAAHWDREWREIAFWNSLDYIGIGAYFPLNAPDSASVDQLAAAWKPYRRAIDSTATKAGRPVLFVEFGYRPVAGTWREPWLYEGGASDPDAQGRAFEALFRAFEDDRWFKGIYVWKSFTDDTTAQRVGEQTGFAFKGLPGEEALKKWWGKSS